MHFRGSPTTLQFTTLHFEVLGSCHLGLDESILYGNPASPDCESVIFQVWQSGSDCKIDILADGLKLKPGSICLSCIWKIGHILQAIPPAISSFPSFAACVSPSCLRERYKTRKLLQTCHNRKAGVMKKFRWLLRGKYPLIGGKFARAFKNAASTSSYLKDTTGSLCK